MPGNFRKMKAISILFLIFTNLIYIQSCSAQHAPISASDYTIAGGKSSTVLPFELFDNRQLIQVKVNGQGPFTFVLDTGAGNLITPEVAEKLGLKLSREFQTGGVGEKSVTGWRTKVAKVEVGELRATNQDFVVLSLSDIQKAIGFEKFDGLLGRELFNSLTTKIDFEKMQFTFTKPDKFDYKGNGEIISFEFLGHIPQIEGEIDGIRGKMVIDTGDRSSLTLYVPFYEKHKFLDKYPDHKKALSGWGIGGSVPAQLIRLGGIQVGNIVVSDVVTRLPLVKSGTFARENQIASIGSGFLKRFNAIFDYQRNRVIFEKNKNFSYQDRFENYILKEI